MWGIIIKSLLSTIDLSYLRPWCSLWVASINLIFETKIQKLLSNDEDPEMTQVEDMGKVQEEEEEVEEEEEEKIVSDILNDQ